MKFIDLHIREKSILEKLRMAFAKPKSVDNPFQYYPESYNQDSSKSIVTKDGRYDLNFFSPHEKEIIAAVLQTAKKKYPKKYYALGLANESYVITYKPRYILFEIITIEFAESASPLELIAVAFAYAMKGASYRKQAISYFEKSIDDVGFLTLDKFSSINSSFVYLKFSELYEGEWQFDKAIHWLNMAKIRGGLNSVYLDEKKKKIMEKKSRAEEGKTRKRNIKPSKDSLQFDEDVRHAAMQFIP